MKLMKGIAPTLLVMMSMAVFGQKPEIRILATGGTIADVNKSNTETDHKAGELGVYQLLEAVPEAKDLTDISGERIVEIGSQDMNDGVWLTLAKRINQLLNREGYDGIAITHETDTMEKTAYFLNLTACSKESAAMVGAMRSAAGTSADGPLNLYNAVAVAADKNAVACGVIVCMNDVVLDAKDVIETNTATVGAPQGANYGKLACTHNDKVFFNRMPENKHTYQSVFNVGSLEEPPKVDIVYSYSNVSRLPMKAFVDVKFDGIVYVGIGSGNLYHIISDLAIKAREQGILFVHSSRVPTGAATLDAEVDDAKYQFIASQTLNPQKVRVLLMLALTKTKDWKQIQKYFDEY